MEVKKDKARGRMAPHQAGWHMSYILVLVDRYQNKWELPIDGDFDEVDRVGNIYRAMFPEIYSHFITK